MTHMNEEMTALARRAVACKGWRWVDGMICVRLECGRRWRPWTPRVWDSGTYLPDLRDPATLGCLLALVREAWDDPTICVVFDHDDGRWGVGVWVDGLVVRGAGATEAGALVDALDRARMRNMSGHVDS